MKKKNNDGKYVTVAGKISYSSYERIQDILSKKGVNIYTMIQNMCDVIIRYSDEQHRIDPDVKKIINMFENMIGWDSNFNLCDGTDEHEITEAIYFFTANGKKGVRVVDVERPFFGMWKQEYNVQRIVERFLKLTIPHTYRRLSDVAKERDCNSVLELLLDIVEEMEIEDDKNEILKMFNDDNNNDFGKKPHEGEPFRRRKTNNSETMEFDFTKKQNEMNAMNYEQRQTISEASE